MFKFHPQIESWNSVLIYNFAFLVLDFRAFILILRPLFSSNHFVSIFSYHVIITARINQISRHLNTLPLAGLSVGIN